MADASDAPSLKIDVGFSLASLEPKISFELPLKFAKKEADGRAVPVSWLRTWWNAWRDARRGLPDYNGEAGAFEQHVRRAEGLKHEQIEINAQSTLLSAADSVVECRPPGFQAAAAVQAAKNGVFGWLKAYRGVLSLAVDRMRLCHAAYLAEKAKVEGFAKSRGLVQEKPRSRISALDRIGILLLASLLEAIVSTILFSEVSEYGYVGGAGYALVVSLANVAAGLAVGFAATYAFNVKKTVPIKAVAVPLMVVLTILVVWMNLLVAHYREKSPFTFGNIFPETAWSGVLLVVGLIVWAYAVYKGWDDFEPDHKGHRDLWHAYEQAKREADGARNHYEALVVAMRANALTELDGIRSQVRAWEADHTARLGFIRSVIRAVEALKRVLPEIKANVAASAKQILSRYRETNFTIRKRKEPELKLAYPARLPPPPDLDIDSVLEDARTAEKMIEQNQTQFERFKDLFEEEVAKRLEEELDKVAAEAEKVRITPS
ncbi:hypothetical protein [Phenylobacterium sp.]|uniref:hypothetical protein n=1 Tax=Phenylobacterium sp. TaxID=1871053 RepID=UPI003BACFB49